MTIGIIVGGWLAFNVLFVIAMLFRRDRPVVDEKSQPFHAPHLARRIVTVTKPATRGAAARARPARDGRRILKAGRASA
jgi:hypothetical protein